MNMANLNGIKIRAITSAVPTYIDDLSGYRKLFGDEVVDKFSAMTGVKQRRIASEKQTGSDLAYAAAVKAMTEENIKPEEIGVCVFVSQTPDYPTPSTACVLQKRLSLPFDCLCFDVNLGCSGFVYGINIVASLMKSNGIEKGLLLTGNTLNKICGDEDRAIGMIQGDAGACTLLVRDDENEMLGMYRSDGSRFKSLIVPAGAFRNRDVPNEKMLWADGNYRSDYNLFMAGDEVFAFTISEVPKMINEHLECINKTVNDFDLFALHQANEMIIKRIAKKCKFPVFKMPISMDRYANASETSIPLTICDAYGYKSGELNTLMCGFGVGLSWGIVTTKLDASHIYPIIETDDYYTDGAVLHE